MFNEMCVQNIFLSQPTLGNTWCKSLHITCFSSPTRSPALGSQIHIFTLFTAKSEDLGNSKVLSVWNKGNVMLQILNLRNVKNSYSLTEIILLTTNLNFRSHVIDM